MHRRQTGKQRGAPGKLSQLVIGERFNVAPHHHVTRVQPHFMAHFRRHQLAVAGKYFHGDTARLQRFQRRGGGLFRRIEEGDITLEDQIGFVDSLIVPLARGQEFARHRHHPQPLSVQVIGDAPDAAQHGVIQRHDVAVIAHLRRHVQDLLQRPFADQLMDICLLAHHHRHPAALEIERDLIHLLPAPGERAGSLLVHPFQHRYVEQVFQPGLVVAVQPGAVQHALAGFAGNIGVVLQHDFVLRQGAGFIGAENVHRAKVLNGVEVFDDHFLFRELHRPARQRGGDDHRQHFRG